MFARQIPAAHQQLVFVALLVTDSEDDLGRHLFFFHAEDGIRDLIVTGVQTCALPICITAGLEAQVMRDGMLVGYVPQIEGSEDFDEPQIVDAIARTDYDQPVARQRTVAPAPGPALTREGGVFRRFLDGFRYR